MLEECKFFPDFLNMLTLFTMGFLGATKEWGDKKAPLPKICRTYPTMIKLRIVIPYLKKIQKLYKSHDTTLEFCWHQHFLTRNQQILPYQEIHIYITFRYVISNSTNLSWVPMDCFNKNGQNFGDVSKNGYPNPS